MVVFEQGQGSIKSIEHFTSLLFHHIAKKIFPIQRAVLNGLATADDRIH